MTTFHAEVVFRFTADNVEAAGSEFQRLGEAAASVGFELLTGRASPASEEEERTAWRAYGPLRRGPEPEDET